MKFYSVRDPEFAPYGSVLEGYEASGLLAALSETPCPEEGTVYVASEGTLEALPVAQEIADRAYGGMPVQLGYCNGHNTKLNCLEYHRDSEMNLGTEDFILLLAKREDVVDGKLDTACVKAFRVPAGVLVEVFATSLHYAPCNAAAGQGFRVLVVLPRGTNTDKPEIAVGNEEDNLLWARNKWLLCHPESPEAGQGAYVGLVGENLDISGEI